MVASGDDAPGLQFIAPYAATTIGEIFMRGGQDALIVFDDLTRHALADAMGEELLTDDAAVERLYELCKGY